MSLSGPETSGKSKVNQKKLEPTAIQIGLESALNMPSKGVPLNSGWKSNQGTVKKQKAKHIDI